MILTLRERLLNTGLSAILSALLLVFAICVGINGIIALNFSQDLEYVESWHAYCSQQACANGQHIGPVDHPPYNVMPYPPVNYLITGALGKLFGGSLEDTRYAGRLLSLISLLASSVMVMLIVKSLGADTYSAFLAGSIFLAAVNFYGYVVSQRPDLLACLLNLVGLYTLIKWRLWIAAGVIFALALSTRHSYVTVPVLAVVFLLWNLEYRHFIRFVLALVLTLCLVSLVADWQMGHYWLQGLLLQNLHGGSIAQAIGFLGTAFNNPVSFPLFLGLASSLILCFLPRVLQGLVLCLVLSFILQTVAMTKRGAFINYLIEPITLGVILFGWFFWKISSEASLMRWRSFALAVLIAILMGQVIVLGIQTRHAGKSYDDKRNNILAAAAYVKEKKGRLLTDVSELYFVSGRDPSWQPLDMVRMTGTSVGSSERQLEQLLSIQYFEVVILDNVMRLGERALVQLKGHYKPQGVVGGYQVYLRSGE